MFFVLFNYNRRAALRIDALFIVAGSHMYFHRTVRDPTALLTILNNLKCNVHIFALTID